MTRTGELARVAALLCAAALLSACNVSGRAEGGGKGGVVEVKGGKDALRPPYHLRAQNGG